MGRIPRDPPLPCWPSVCLCFQRSPVGWKPESQELGLSLRHWGTRQEAELPVGDLLLRRARQLSKSVAPKRQKRGTFRP